MDPLRVIAQEHGVFLRREARECGYSDKQVTAMRRQGVWRRVRQGCYCFADVWAAATAEQRHLILLRAVLRTTPGPVVASHVSALVLRGVATWGADLSRVHVTRLDSGSARIERDVTHHVGTLTEDDLEVVGGITSTGAARAVVEAATVLPTESAVVSADNAMHLGLTDAEAIEKASVSVTHWPGSQRLHLVIRWMDGRRESPGETRSFMLFRRHGLPTPVPQYEVRDESGRLVAVIDFAWLDHRVFGEFDGRLKYTDRVAPGADPREVLWREKQREDLVRELTGFVFLRLIWADLEREEQTARRVRSVLLRAA